MARCEKCGAALRLGDWPWCPHGQGHSNAIGDDIPGGLVMEHVEPGRKVYSKSELKRVLSQHGYQLRERHVDNGTIKDVHLSRWTGIPQPEDERLKAWHAHEATLQR